LIAATHRNLADMVHNGKFREDLWYRVNVFPLLLPRLAERPEDIPALAQHFAQRAAKRFGLNYVEPSVEEIQLLVQYPWPGNIRELGAVMDRAVILGEGQRIEVAKALGISRPAVRRKSDEPTFYEVIPEDDFIPRTAPAKEEIDLLDLDAAMKRHIERVLIHCQGKIEGRSGAAEKLQVNPHTLRAKMRKLGIDWSRYRPQ
jgi:hydrogenase-4 transcriptional activator